MPEDVKVQTTDAAGNTGGDAAKSDPAGTKPNPNGGTGPAAVVDLASGRVATAPIDKTEHEVVGTDPMQAPAFDLVKGLSASTLIKE